MTYTVIAEETSATTFVHGTNIRNGCMHICGVIKSFSFLSREHIPEREPLIACHPNAGNLQERL
jgi:hypothetical protein